MSKSIEFEDVQVGDLVEGTYKGDGFYAPGESAVYRGWVKGTSRYAITTQSFTFSKTAYPTLTLIERPEPEEPTKIGTLVKMGNGRTAILTPLTSEFRVGADESRSPWLYFSAPISEWSSSEQPEWLTWGELLGQFGQGVVEIIEPGEVA